MLIRFYLPKRWYYAVTWIDKDAKFNAMCDDIQIKSFEFAEVWSISDNETDFFSISIYPSDDIMP